MRLKVLPLDRWMTKVYTNPEDFKSCVHGMKKILPILNRDGIYKYGKLYWFESMGVAYKYWSGMFDFTLNILHASELNERQAQALKDIVEQKLATRKQRELHYFRKQYAYIQSIKRNYGI
jgi:hypothetical protein